MKCESCKTETIVNRQRYHYTECGLDNVYLENIEVRICPACGFESPRIPHINELHDTIGRAIVLQNAPLSGREARFLRKQIGLKAREWAEYMRVDVTTLSRWENEEQQIGAQSEALIRMLYSYLMFKKVGQPMLDGLIEAIAAVAPGTRAEVPAVLVNPRYPERYSYHSRAELACA